MILILIKIINNQRIRITRSNVKSSEDIKSYIYLAMTIFYLVIKIILKKIDLGISKTFVGFFKAYQSRLSCLKILIFIKYMYLKNNLISN